MLPKPEFYDIKGPSGPDIAAIFGDRLTLTYWDFWCLLAARQEHGNDLRELQKTLIDQRMNGRFWSFYKRDLVEDLITLVVDLEIRLSGLETPEKILAYFPERLIKKESAKAVRNILKQEGSYPPSEPMLRSPRRLLEKEAFRGMWPELPIDPTSFAGALRPLFIPSKKMGYFSKDSTFDLSGKVEKAVAKEISKAHQSHNPEAHKHAIYRAALSLFHEEHHWDDSYGTMGDLGQEWVKALLSTTPESIGSASSIFLKDLLMFFCWENYGLSYSKDVAAYILSRPLEEQRLAKDILTDIQSRASQGFQEYHAENAEKILSFLGVSPPTKPRLTLMNNHHAT
jgi:hypothetical protein